ncbi:MAG: sulfate adenylyltransferase subunit CysN [Spirochaeta sp.]|jgi:bifunctional enzyme CysN/CysC|nr:sulfate adenylyltransferase subunit CysN [Spirochaeta sp.]
MSTTQGGGAAATGGTATGASGATTIVHERDLLRFTTAGSVDDGKSTLIGRMLFDSKQIFQDQMDQLESASKLRGEENVNLALLTDGLRSEREQGITIDVAFRYFTTPKRKFIIADTPGHEQYTRNMVTGASTADLAIVLIDARNGVLTQSKRHGIIASLLGIPHVVVAINKMDLVDYSQERYEEIRVEYQDFARKLSINDIEFIPVSALVGDNVVDRSDRMPWYEGPPLLQFLETVTISGDRNLVDFRFPVQYVVRPHQDFRGFSGRIASGSISVGEEILVLPSRQRSRIKGIHYFKDELEEAFAGQSVILTLEDEIDISRGDMIVRSHNIPEVATEFDATLTWMDDQHDLDLNTQYVLQHTSRLTKAYVDDLVYRIDVNTLHRDDADTLKLNEIGRVKVTSANPIFFDPYDRNRNTGGFVLIDPHDFRTVGAGMIRHASAGTMEELRKEQRRDRLTKAGADGAGDASAPASTNIFWDPGYVGLEDRVRRNGHRPRVIWFSGISGSGKSTIAKDLEKKLFDAGKNAVRLDGDNVRHGLNADLAFSREDRRENIRRVGHLARQLYDVGNIVLCTFVSPYAEDRDAARALFPEGDFIEVFVKVDLEEARRRDPKGLYAKVDNGEIRGFTGVDAPYEAPERPEVIIDSGKVSVDEAVEMLMEVVG